MEFQEPDWAWLPEGIVLGILDCIVSFYDYTRFVVVCKHWYSVAKDQYTTRQMVELWNKQLPLLMIPSTSGDKDDRSLYNVITGKTYDFPVKLHYDQRCCGYSYGWLATLDENMIITLRNPFLNQTIPLPPIENLIRINTDPDVIVYGSEYAIYKVLLSRDPYLHPNSVEVVAMYRCGLYLAILKPGSESWICLDERTTYAVDIIYFEDMLLAVNRNGGLVSINANSRAHEVATIVRSDRKNKDEFEHSTVYLVKSSSGALLLIRRYVDLDEVTTHFKVYMLIRSLNNKVKAHWDEIKSLGNDAVFVADWHGLCIQASNFPGCRPNSIYFAHQAWFAPFGKRNHDMGIFNLENGSIVGHYPYDESQEHLPRPVWLVPTIGAGAGDGAGRSTEAKKS